MNKELTAWDRVEIARNPKRKTSIEYIENIFDDFIELHGDRNYKDDKAIVCGLASIGNQNFTVIAEQKGRTTKELIKEIADEGMTMVIVSHEMNFVRECANKILFINEGVVSYFGPVEEAFNDKSNERLNDFLNKTTK